ncbi:MAG: penicillin acylase family protein [Nitriliruptor sp.]|nr:MAG: penicillin acylase family protein [Nitriliruptor sp.]
MGRDVAAGLGGPLVIWVKRLSVSLAVLLAVGLVLSLVTGTWMVRRSFPTTSGQAELVGLDQDVEVYRDAYGVPTIVAATSADLYRAQGYVHAQDRFWEMDLRRHVTAGRVAELLGADAVDTDRFIRTLGWRRVAEAELDLLEEDTLAMLEAYAEGVNAWVEGRSGSQLSIEHALLRVTGAGGYQPEPWTPADSVAWLKAMAWDLRANLEDELLRARLLDVDLGEGRELDDLFPAFPAQRHPVILPQGGESTTGGFVPATGVQDPDQVAATAAAETRPDQPEDERDELLQSAELLRTPGADAALTAAHEALALAPALLGEGGGDGIGSNSWVLGPDRTTTGAPLLANDPHLGPAQPSLWYQVGLQCEPVGPDCPYELAGFSFSGVPGIVIGHNARIAWGFTNLGADVADLVIERIDADRYLTEDGWEPLDVREETIRVAGGDDVTIEVRSTRHGPLFSDVSGSGEEIAQGRLGAADPDAEDEVEHAVALRWVALDPVGTMDAVPRLMRAEDWPSFRAAASRFEVPSQNLVYADVDGNIGYQAPGRIPVRRSGDGTLPQAGWTGEAGWERFLDFEELPWTLNPDDGYLATANQPVLNPGSDPFLAVDVSLGHRGARIAELLEAREQHGPEDLLALQMDNHNANAATLVPVVTDLDDRDHAGVALVQQVLADWDLQDDADAAGAAAFNATWRHLLEITYHDLLPEWAWPTGGGRWWETVRGLLDEPDSPWWEAPGEPDLQGRDDVLHAAMARAHEEMETTFSDDPADWRWGEMHTLTLTHSPFGESGIAPIERLFNRGPLELGGGSDIVNATGWTAHQGYEVNWVPSMRMIVDLGDLDDSRWINLTGQSGRPFHRHYSDQAEPWRDGQTIPLRFSLEAARENAVDRLTLTAR